MARASTLVINVLIQVDLPAPVAPAMRMWGIFARFATTYPPSMSLPRPTNSGCGLPVASSLRRTSPSETSSLSVLGISMPTALLPGIGLMIRTSGLFTAYAMFLVSWMIRSTFTAAPSSTS